MRHPQHLQRTGDGCELIALVYFSTARTASRVLGRQRWVEEVVYVYLLTALFTQDKLHDHLVRFVPSAPNKNA
jgi:hypothetical protein